MKHVRQAAAAWACVVGEPMVIPVVGMAKTLRARAATKTMYVACLLLALAVILTILWPTRAAAADAAWAAQSSPTASVLSGIWGSSSSDVLACGASGTILRYNGAAWSSMSSGTTYGLYDIWGASSDNVFVVGSGGVIRRIQGGSWSDAGPSGTAEELYGVWGSSGSDVFAVGNNGTILHYDGSAWTPMVHSVTQNLFSVWGSAGNDVYAVGSGSVVAHYDGAIWTSTSVAGLVNLWGVWGSAADDVFAVGDRGTVLHYNGVSWSSMTSGTANQLMGVWGTSSTDVFAVGVGGKILHYEGAGWSPMDTGSTKNLRGVWGAAATDVYAVGGDGVILHYDEDTPTVTSVNPGVGYQGQTVSAVIQGANFSGATDVGFGAGITVNRFHVDTPGQITASIVIDDPVAAGARDVSVTTPAGTATRMGAFRVILVAPTVSAVSPGGGTQGQSLSATIAGTYLSGASDVSFGSGITVNGYTINSATEITASVSISSSASVGIRDVSVTTRGGTGTKTGAFAVSQASPYVGAVSPDSGIQGQRDLSVTIGGAYFSGASDVSFGSGIAVDGYTVKSGTQIVASISISDSALIGARTVSVTTPAGTDTFEGGFNVVAELPPPQPPAVTTVSPGAATPGEALEVVITGSNLGGVGEVSFGAGITADYVVDSPTQITASIRVAEDAAIGARDVIVTTPDGNAVLAGGFEVVTAPPLPQPPGVTAVSPAAGALGEGLEVVISGNNLGGASEVSFGPGIMVDYVVDSPTLITASIMIAEDAAIGARDVTVTTADGTGIMSGGFEVVVAPVPPQPPQIVGVSPTKGTCDEVLEVVITGSNLGGASEVDFGSGIVVSYVYVGDSETQITVGLVINGDAAAGNRDVMVTSAGGTATLEGGFEVISAVPFPHLPEVMQVTPRTGARGEELQVIISGDNLGGVSEVSFGAGIVVSYVGDSATQITAELLIAEDAATGARDVIVTTPAGGRGLDGGFEVVAESRQGFSPFTPWFWIGIILFGVLVAFFLVATRERKPEAKRWSLLPPSYGG